MTREEVINILNEMWERLFTEIRSRIFEDLKKEGKLDKFKEAHNIAIKALEQEPKKDEVILTNKEYRELIANEYDNGYCKGYAVALEEQESILDKIRAEIQFIKDKCLPNNIAEEYEQKGLQEALDIIDKYKGESEE